jgi:hypothetical protein
MQNLMVESRNMAKAGVVFDPLHKILLCKHDDGYKVIPASTGKDGLAWKIMDHFSRADCHASSAGDIKTTAFWRSALEGLGEVHSVDSFENHCRKKLENDVYFPHLPLVATQEGWTCTKCGEAAPTDSKAALARHRDHPVECCKVQKWSVATNSKFFPVKPEIYAPDLTALDPDVAAAVQAAIALNSLPPSDDAEIDGVFGSYHTDLGLDLLLHQVEGSAATLAQQVETPEIAALGNAIDEELRYYFSNVNANLKLAGTYILGKAKNPTRYPLSHPCPHVFFRDDGHKSSQMQPQQDPKNYLHHLKRLLYFIVRIIDPTSPFKNRVSADGNVPPPASQRRPAASRRSVYQRDESSHPRIVQAEPRPRRDRL